MSREEIHQHCVSVIFHLLKPILNRSGQFMMISKTFHFFEIKNISENLVSNQMTNIKVSFDFSFSSHCFGPAPFLLRTHLVKLF